MRFLFHRKAIQYLFFEMWPSLIMGILIFIFIMIMFQAIHYTEFVLIHGVGVWTVVQMLSYICIGFLPALFPMSLLFSVLMTYGRLSQDSEIVALKSTGHSMWTILTPAVLISIMVSLLSAQTSFNLAPWGNRQFEILISKLEQSKASATIREGTFSEGFFDLVVYAKEVESKTGKLSKIFIYDERESDVPLTVIARQGKMVQDDELGRSVFLRLFDGDIHRQGLNHTKIKFNSFDIKLVDPMKEELRAKTPSSLTLDEIYEKLKNSKLEQEDQITLEVEYHKRWAISLACIIFSLLGVGLGTTTNSRHQKNNGMIMSLIVVIMYWVIYITAESAARSGKIPVPLAMWIPNFTFFSISIWSLKKNWD